MLNFNTTNVRKINKQFISKKYQHLYSSVIKGVSNKSLPGFEMMG
jgi:hypothetical protein